MSGSIIITGASTKEQLLISYNFIDKFIKSKKELIELK